MASKIFVNQIRDGLRIDSTFLVTEKSLRDYKSKDGRYLALTLADRTGTVSARVWDGAEEWAKLFQEGQVVRVVAAAQRYQDALQLIVNRIERVEPREVSPEDYLPRSDQDPKPLWQYLRDRTARVANPFLRQLLEGRLADAEFLRDFEHCPASRRLHHSYLGGLLEHVVSVARLGEAVCALCPDADADLVFAGAFLHDVGKLEEYKYDVMIDKTTQGVLLGHIPIGDRMCWAWMDAIPGFPAGLKLAISHMILSHHGELAYGSPKRPKTLEALVLHHVENLDAQMANFRAAVAKAKEEGKEWTDYDRLFERRLFAGELEGMEE